MIPLFAAGILLSVAGTSYAAAPSPTAAHRAAYCALLTTFNKKENAARQVYSSPASPVASMKSAYKQLNAVALRVLRVAPSPLQATYDKELRSLHQVYSELAKANFDYLELPETEILGLESIQSMVNTETKKITTYDKKYCSVKG